MPLNPSAPSASRPATPNPAAADDGDALHSAFSDACMSQGYDKAALGELHVLVDHVGPFQAGDYLFRAGDPFDSIAAVRAGMVKTFVDDSQGNEQVLGFSLPGEVIGLNAIHGARFNAVALDTVYLCRISFPRLSLLATRMPGLQARLFSLLSAEIGKVATLAANHRTEAHGSVPAGSFRALCPARFLCHPFQPEHGPYRDRPADGAGDGEPGAAPVERRGVIAVNQREMLLLQRTAGGVGRGPGIRTGLIRQARGRPMMRAGCCCWDCWPRCRPGRPR